MVNTDGKAKLKWLSAEIAEANKEPEAKKVKLWLLWESLLDISLLNVWQQIDTK